MTTLREYLDMMLLEYAVDILREKDPDESRMRILEKYMVLINKYLVGA